MSDEAYHYDDCELCERDAKSCTCPVGPQNDIDGGIKALIAEIVRLQARNAEVIRANGEIGLKLAESWEQNDCLRAALKQAYIDGGCREDEAEEMVRALSAKDSPPSGYSRMESELTYYPPQCGCAYCHGDKLEDGVGVGCTCTAECREASVRKANEILSEKGNNA